MRVVVFGAGGQVGRALVAWCESIGDEVAAYRHADVDVGDGARVREVVRAARAEVVFNGAAYTAVDRAEAEPDAADAINARAVRRMAEVCRDLSVPLVHFSS